LKCFSFLYHSNAARRVESQRFIIVYLSLNLVRMYNVYIHMICVRGALVVTP
jgi:hypothetical protein